MTEAIAVHNIKFWQMLMFGRTLSDHEIAEFNAGIEAARGIIFCGAFQSEERAGALIVLDLVTALNALPLTAISSVENSKDLVDLPAEWCAKLMSGLAEFGFGKIFSAGMMYEANSVLNLMENHRRAERRRLPPKGRQIPAYQLMNQAPRSPARRRK